MIVVKVGGAAGVEYDTVCADLAQLAHDKQPWVLVHGGSHETNEVAAQLGHPPEFVTSVSGYTSRRTDRRTIEIFEMVYCGKTNKGIVERLQKLGRSAQVLVVTHAPQVAARAASHIRIVKTSGRKSAATDAVPLDDAARREELARMLAGATITDEARAAAASLLKAGAA